MIKNTIYDSGGNNNGRLDPGETVNLTATLKNIGGVNFSNLSTTIISSDSYVTISDNSGNFGSLPVDTTKENTADPYTISASASAPQGHKALFKLIATDGGYTDTFDFSVVVGRIHYFVWNPDLTPASGRAIHNILSDLGYSGNYDVKLPTSSELANYYAVFVCVGVYSDNYVIRNNSPEANTLVDFLQNQNGRMYLEGGEVWYYDPRNEGGYNFGPLFGINATGDGSGDMGPVVGQNGTFTNQMNFSYGGDNAYMDHISPTDSGSFLIFRDGNNNYDCGVARDIGSYKTVGTSFELGGLVDGSGVSTRAALLDSIMHFFGISLVAVEECAESKPLTPHFMLWPNPSRDNVSIELSNFNLKNLDEITVFDATGRLIKKFRNIGSEKLIWNRRDDRDNLVSAGVYFVRVEAADYTQTQKLILLR